MGGFGRFCIAGLGFLTLASLSSADAQENLDLGKTPAQLYAADCAICHKSPQGMTKNVGPFGLSNFLREHYTASRQSAAAIAAYVESVDKGPPAAAKHPPRKRSAKGDEKGKEKGARVGQTSRSQSRRGKARAGQGQRAQTCR